ALARAEAGMAHGVEQPPRPAEFLAQRPGTQEPVQQGLAVLRSLIEAVLKLRRRRHAILAVDVVARPVYARRAIFSSPRIWPSPAADCILHGFDGLPDTGRPHGYRRKDRMIFDAIAALALAIWLYLVAGRGGFWLCRERDGNTAAT